MEVREAGITNRHRGQRQGGIHENTHILIHIGMAVFMYVYYSVIGLLFELGRKEDPSQGFCTDRGWCSEGLYFEWTQIIHFTGVSIPRGIRVHYLIIKEKVL
jgi:hypothetical protein